MKRLLTIIIATAVLFGPAFSQKKEVSKVRTVVIDPGHGGDKPGAIGSRSQEKDITLSVALKFGRLIKDNYPDVNVIYTRTTDVDISLAERAHIANRNKADLFISVHANSHPTSTPTGVETFVMGLSESKANLEVARKENSDILLEADYKNNSDYQGFDPSAPETYVMLAMFQSAFLDKSLNFAQYIQNQYKQNIKTINRGVKQAELFVLYKTSMPSVLTEIGFISNPEEETYMLSEEGQNTIANCLFNAFMEYKLAEDGTAKPVATTSEFQVPGTKPVPSVEMPRREPQTNQPVADQTSAVALQQMAEESSEKADRQAASEAAAQARQKAERQAAAEADAAARAKLLAERKAAAEAENAAKAMQLAEKKAAAEALARARQEAATKPATTNPQEPGKTHHSNGLELPKNTASSDRQFYTVQFMLADRVFKAGDRELQGIDEFDIIRKKNGLAYCCGRFATFQEASDYCKRVIAVTTFDDAWPFLCKLGEGVNPVSESKVKRATGDQANVQQPVEARTIETKAAPEIQRMPVETKEENIGVFYRVQFLISTRELQRGDPDLCGISDIIIEQDGNMYKYLAGYFETRREAEQRCAGIKVRTPFKDAFVVTYKDGERVR